LEVDFDIKWIALTHMIHKHTHKQKNSFKIQIFLFSYMHKLRNKQQKDLSYVQPPKNFIIYKFYYRNEKEEKLTLTSETHGWMFS